MEKIKKLVPKIRFPQFTDAWEQRKVSGYSSFLTGNGLNWNDVTDDGKQECILYGNLYTDYGMIADKVTYRTNSEIKNPVYSEYGDVLIPASDTTPTGLARATSLEKAGVLLGGDINIIRPNEGINGSCLSLSLNANKNELIRLIKGTTVRHIHNSEIKDIVICLPKNEDEQIKISAYFKQLDNLITLHQREYEKLKELKKAMLQKIFSQEIRFKNDDGTEFPEWEERELNTLFPKIRNGFVGTVTDCFSDKETGIRYIEGTNIHNGIISDNVEVYVTKEFHNSHINSQLKADDIVMVQSGHIGDCAVVGKKYEGSNCHALIIMSNGGKCSSQFYNFYFHSENGFNKLRIFMQGNTVKHILASDMQTLVVPVPCLSEQQKIADFLSNFDEAISYAKQELDKWKELKKGLLQQMFV